MINHGKLPSQRVATGTDQRFHVLCHNGSHTAAQEQDTAVKAELPRALTEGWER